MHSLLRRFSSTVPRSMSSKEAISIESIYGAHNYHPIPVVFSKAKGVVVTDPEGKEYYDFLAAYSAVNQGHCHPKILAALHEQAEKVTLSSRAFYNDQFPVFAQKVTSMFGYQRVLPANGGVEGVEAAIKIARKWGYEKKGIRPGQAVFVGVRNCFHGRTVAAISLSNDEEARENFGPFLPNMETVPINDSMALRRMFEAKGDQICGFMIEPIQGEAGVILATDSYLREVAHLCKKHNVLFIADEIQSGLGRAGKMLAIQYSGLRPDMLILGKALSGGVLPVSALLADDEVMLVVKPGQHGSTYGGNSLASAVSVAALDVLVEDHLVENSFLMGELFRRLLRESGLPSLLSVRGRGLMNAIDIESDRVSAWDICVRMAEKGLLAKPTHNKTIRLTPPLCITEKQLRESAEIICSTVKEMVH